MRATRRQALAGAAAAGLAAALPAPASAKGEDDTAASALAAALALKQTTAVAYEAIANGGVLTNLLRDFLEHEREHMAQLEFAVDALGAEPPVAPSRDEIGGLEEALAGRAAAAEFAIGLELRAIIALQNAIQASVDPNVARTCAGAMGTDAQQLVVLRQTAGVPPVPAAFERGLR
jgi:hypothetical protein